MTDQSEDTVLRMRVNWDWRSREGKPCNLSVEHCEPLVYGETITAIYNRALLANRAKALVLGYPGHRGRRIDWFTDWLILRLDRWWTRRNRSS